MSPLVRHQPTYILSYVTRYLHTSSAKLHQQTWRASNWCVPSQTRGVFKASQESSFKSQHKQDGVSKDFVMVYSKIYQKCFTLLVPHTWIVGAVFLSISGYHIWNILDSDPSQQESVDADPSQQESVSIRLGSIPMNPLTVYCVSFALTLIFLVIMAKMTKSIVLRMYYKEEMNEFVAVVLRYGFFRRTIKFSPSDVKHVKLQEFGGTYEVKGEKFDYLHSEFLSVKYLNLFTGVIVQNQVHPKNTFGNRIMKS
ncbi:hypothetical protein DPMN_179697 [Dreissena polymorpha]|uniref:Uncharacterized protein n=1 Tax=Dreissena polymorpha TaxID=45954 RepID=A0A9D4EDA1_DREPO|nr:hypothetical protein DPMN_179697 [Dreissena polymorpha]